MGAIKKSNNSQNNQDFKKGIKVFPSGGGGSGGGEAGFDGVWIDKQPTIEAIIVINVTILNDHDFCLEMICLIEKFITEPIIAYVGLLCDFVFIFLHSHQLCE